MIIYYIYYIYIYNILYIDVLYILYIDILFITYIYIYIIYSINNSSKYAYYKYTCIYIYILRSFASVRFKHSVCPGSLMTFYIYLYIERKLLFALHI